MKYLLLLFIVFSTKCALAQSNRIDSAQLDSIVQQATKYENQHPNRAMGGALFLGTGFYHGNISKYFNDPLYIGINIEFHRSRWLLQLDDYIGFGKVKEDMVFTPDAVWKKNDMAFSAMFSGNIGYSLIDTKNYKLVPLAGIGFTLLSSKLLGSSAVSAYEPLLGTYKAGAYVDIKAMKFLQPEYNDEGYYTCLRVSFGLSNTIGTPKYSNFYSGPMAYITVGLGGFSE